MIEILLTAVCAALTIILLLRLLSHITEWFDSRTTIDPYQPPKPPGVEVDGERFQITKAGEVPGQFPLDFPDAHDVQNPYFQVQRVDKDGKKMGYAPTPSHDQAGNLITQTPDGTMHRYSRKDLEDLMPTNYYRYYSLRKGDEEIGYGRR